MRMAESNLDAELGGRRRTLAVILVLGTILAPPCRCAPSVATKPTWFGNNDIPPILASSCDPGDRRCWNWRTLGRSRPLDFVPEQDLEYRSQPIYERDVDLQMRDTEARESSNRLLHQGPGRPVKKDVFMSRGWGAGGMPFSVLYMSPRVHGSKVDSARRAVEGAGHPAPARLALRNGGLGQARRHYSIIPQLFISYGWGPSGK